MSIAGCKNNYSYTLSIVPSNVWWFKPKMRHFFTHSTPPVAQTELTLVNFVTMTFSHNLRCPQCTCSRGRPVRNKLKANSENQRERWVGVYLRPLGRWTIQDHTSQDHFCSLIDEFLTRNLDSDQPRWRVETTGSKRETVADWTRSIRVPFHDIEDRSACVITCRGASRVLSGKDFKFNENNWNVGFIMNNQELSFPDIHLTCWWYNSYKLMNVC